VGHLGNPAVQQIAGAGQQILMNKLLYYLYQTVLSPVSIIAILTSAQIHLAYKISVFDKLLLGYRMFFNWLRVPTGTNPKVHLAMALKLLELPPNLNGDVLECGTWKGGTAANLSLICRHVGRRLLVYDSFEGLPRATAGDREAKHYSKGDYCGTLDEVKRNIERYGAIEVCEFVKGWFEDTLPTLAVNVALAYLDVDLEASLHTCVKYIWPRLIDEGYIFIDECANPDYCALFYSERWWNEHFNRTPPGLVGAGTGLPLGDFYIGPISELTNHPLQHPSTGAYTSKRMSGYWSYYPPEVGGRMSG
jgi:O-methyltransferase